MEADSAAVQDPPSVLDALCISAFDFLQKSYTFIRPSLSDQNPLLSIFVTFYALVLVYLPHLFFSLFCSPVLISTAILLASILHLGASQKTQLEKDDTFRGETEKADPVDECPIDLESKPAAQTEEIDAAVATKPHFSEPFVEWSRRGPLEVIYEEYEEEEEEESPENEHRRVGLDRQLSLSLYYPDSDDSSDGEFPEDFPAWNSPEHLCFRWEEEREEGLIEIPLCGKRTAGFQLEEENLIEIDLSIPGK